MRHLDTTSIYVCQGIYNKFPAQFLGLPVQRPCFQSCNNANAKCRFTLFPSIVKSSKYIRPDAFMDMLLPRARQDLTNAFASKNNRAKPSKSPTLLPFVPVPIIMVTCGRTGLRVLQGCRAPAFRQVVVRPTSLIGVSRGSER